MQKRKGYIYPRIVEEIVDTAELCKVWNCHYLTVNRIMYGRRPASHIKKQQLSDYLGIPINELFLRVDPDPIPKDYAYVVPSKVDLLHPTADNSEISSESEEEV